MNIGIRIDGEQVKVCLQPIVNYYARNVLCSLERVIRAVRIAQRNVEIV